MQSLRDNYAVAAFYQFMAIENPEGLRDRLTALCARIGLKGTILLAVEGINGTMAGEPDGVMQLKQFLEERAGFRHLEWKLSFAPEPPFRRMKVKIKSEIVTMGVAGIDPNRHAGEKVSSDQWNRLIDDPDVLVIDARNRYEVEIGSFRNAVSPQTDHFRQFPQFVDSMLDPGKHRKIAMFCTGGIRCEKASAYLLKQGFDEVYHLGGGILRYLEATSKQNNAFEGECFVFDGRVAVDPDLARGKHDLCYGCRRPVSAAHRQSPRFEEGVCCPACHATLSEERKARFRERHRQEKLAAERGTLHVGAVMKGGD